MYFSLSDSGVERFSKCHAATVLEGFGPLGHTAYYHLEHGRTDVTNRLGTRIEFVFAHRICH